MGPKSRYLWRLRGHAEVSDAGYKLPSEGCSKPSSIAFKKTWGFLSIFHYKFFASLARTLGYLCHKVLSQLVTPLNEFFFSLFFFFLTTLERVRERKNPRGHPWQNKKATLLQETPVFGYILVCGFAFFIFFNS